MKYDQNVDNILHKELFVNNMMNLELRLDYL